MFLCVFKVGLLNPMQLKREKVPFLKACLNCVNFTGFDKFLVKIHRRKLYSKDVINYISLVLQLIENSILATSSSRLYFV